MDGFPPDTDLDPPPPLKLIGGAALEVFEDAEVAAEFNKLPDYEIPPELQAIVEEYPLDMTNGGPPRQHPDWGGWMGLRRKHTGRHGGRKPKPPVSADDVLSAAGIDSGEPDEQDTKEPVKPAVVAQKLAQAYRAAAIAVLANDLDSKDEGVRQRAAIKLLEISDGKPGQQPAEAPTGPTTIVYETVALQQHAPFTPGAGLTSSTGGAE